MGKKSKRKEKKDKKPKEIGEWNQMERFLLTQDVMGKLKELGAEGKLTSEVVLRALRKIETDGAASLKELVANDPTQIFKNFQNVKKIPKLINNGIDIKR